MFVEGKQGLLGETVLPGEETVFGLGVGETISGVFAVTIAVSV